MSLKSRKSCKNYNRANSKAQLWDIVDEQQAKYDPREDYELDDCDCAYCNPSLGTIRTNQLFTVLWKLRVIKDIADHMIW